MSRLLRLSDVMSVSLVTTGPDTPIRDAARLMRDRRVGCVLVTEGPVLAGIATERDLVRAVADGCDPQAPVSTIMSDKLILVDPDSDVVDAAQTMATKGIRHLPVAQEGMLAGVVSMRDIVRWGLTAISLDGCADEAREAFSLLATGGTR